MRETAISVSSPEGELGRAGITFRLSLEPKGSWQTCIDVVAASNLDLATGVTTEGGRERRAKYAHGETDPRPYMGSSLAEWLGGAPRLVTDWEALRPVYRQSLVDLAALRFHSYVVSGATIPAAGLPWFMAIFGRDSIITSIQTLPYLPELGESTLRVLARRQGTRVDDFRDEEPGKIMHEVRAGELTAFEERPHSPYFGTCDATPLYLILLDEYVRWTGDVELVRQLEPSARLALDWIDEYGDRDGDGFVEYERRNVESGLENQCWKDSWDSILFADGSLAPTPLATCEIQGYVYDAKVRCARLAREVWHDQRLAERLEESAVALKRRFNDVYWIPERGFFALALDGEKRQVDSLTSNIGHLLWSGIADDEKAQAVAERLLSEELFSGWGIRTMATTEGGYNPIRYHDGTVWPHDNSLIALGLARYGFRRQVATIAQAIVEAATFFRDRLPEVFAGYPRSLSRYPVQYPTACSPQAWASGAPLALITAMLRLEPGADGIASDPVLPDGVGTVDLLGLRGQQSRAQVEAARFETPRDFFERLAARPNVAARRGQEGSFNVDVGADGCWTVTIRGGKLTVAEGSAPADVTFKTTGETFMRIVSGDQNANTAFLSGKVAINGDYALGQQLVRLLLAEVH